ncbi:hypothetical protein SCUCBS95973_007060 [Sporothrix curviconia]|uniref:Uncharacterized protein n=1 Tax=Sporothrix curviconia TaxID=1260050 RepID=A0ABP0CAX3_9PEZI
MGMQQLACLAALAAAVHAVTVLPGGLPKPYAGATGALTPYDFYTQSAANEFGNRSVDVFMSNRDNVDYFVRDDYRVLPSADSVVRGALQAWGEHLHLVLQPDELWLTVLAQVNFYVNAHAAEVAARGVYDLRANETVVDAYYPDWYTFMASLYAAVTQRTNPATNSTSGCRCDWLQHEWISPNFTTSTNEHVMAAHILMLARTRPFVRPPLPSTGAALLCGLPSVTLLGTRQDWAILQWRVQQLHIFGPEAAAYGDRLLPVVRRFVETYDKPDDPAIQAFWNAIVVAQPAASSSIRNNKSATGSTGSTGSTAPLAAQEPASCGGSTNGPSFNISGWITAFYFWDANGKPFGRDVPSIPTTTLDNVTYPSIDLRTLPVAYGRTSMVLPHFNDTDNFEILAMGGPMGKRIDNGAPAGYFEALNRTRGLNIVPWVESDGNDTVEVDGPPTDSRNQTFVQWANASFGGYDPRAHATLSPLTSWVLYGPDKAAGNSSSNRTLTTEAMPPTLWQRETELGTIAAALLSHYNATHCSVAHSSGLASRFGRRNLQWPRRGW